MPRIRTINQAYEEIQQSDPNTAITAFRIRQLILNGAVPSFKAGKRYMVDMDNLESYLSNPTAIQDNVTYGVIRPVNVKLK